MQVLVKGKQVQVGDALRTYVTDRLSSAVNKYFDDAIEAQVIFSLLDFYMVMLII